MPLDGYTIFDEGDPRVDLAETIVAEFSHVSEPGAWLVDTFPIRESPIRQSSGDRRSFALVQ
jgi:hypothetical protein